MTAAYLWLGLWAVTRREIAKFVRQTERLLAALVRPTLWLLVFASGLHDLLGVSIIPPYRTYTPYQEYILPGLMGIVILFQCMQSALSMIYDREAGVMRVMLVSPLPRSFLLFAKIAAATILSVLQAYAFLIVALVLDTGLPSAGYLTVLPAMILTGIMLGSIGLLVSVYTPQIENFAGMMNFVVFPMFFLSSALYPLWKLREAGAEAIYYVSLCNPFTHAVELMRFAAYGQFNVVSAAVVAGSAFIAFVLAARGYDAHTGAIRRIKRPSALTR
ncbi:MULTISPECIES: ABC transporter permease [unclassified Devosia]|uniref:ABC transporter permease n=1 Tax=unclassified Devosia TaxID=196773 RepID=UPI001552421C